MLALLDEREELIRLVRLEPIGRTSRKRVAEEMGRATGLEQRAKLAIVEIRDILGEELASHQIS